MDTRTATLFFAPESRFARLFCPKIDRRETSSQSHRGPARTRPHSAEPFRSANGLRPTGRASPGTGKPIPGTYQNLQRVVDASRNLSLELESLVQESLALESRPVRLPRCRSPLCLCRRSCLCNRCRRPCNRPDPCTRSGLCIRVCPFLHQPSSGERPPHGQRCSLHRHARPRIQLGGLQPPLQRSWPWMV